MFQNPIAKEVKSTLLKVCPSAKEGYKKGGTNTRRRGLTLPSLAQARSDFEQYIGGVIDWPDE